MSLLGGTTVKINRLVFGFLLIFSSVLVFSCPNKTNKESDTHTPSPSPNPDPKPVSAPVIPSDIAKDFVKVDPPETGIVGDSTDLKFPEKDAYWRGVFVKNRTCKLTPFRMAKYETTYKVWKEVYDWAIKNQYKFSGAGRKGGAKQDKYTEAEHTEAEPVTNVTWSDCVVWCNAYTHKVVEKEDECVYTKDGETIKDATDEDLFVNMQPEWDKGGFRLPTEAEWEFSARYQGEDATNAVKLGDFYYTRLDSASGAKKPIGFKKLKYEGASKDNKALWDELKDELNRVSVYRAYFTGEDYGGNDFDDKGTGYELISPEIVGTAVVGSKEPNTLGLYDMSGNVAEWVYDFFCDPPMPKEGEIETDPVQASPFPNEFCVIKGASWAGWSCDQLIGYRAGGQPHDQKDDQLGFRLVYRYKEK